MRPRFPLELAAEFPHRFPALGPALLHEVAVDVVDFNDAS